MINSFLTAIRARIYQFRQRRRYPSSVIHYGAIVDPASSLGRYSVLFKGAKLMHASLGAFSYVQENSLLSCADVGPFCSIAANVTVGLVNHPTAMVSTSPLFYDNTQPLPYSFVPDVLWESNLGRTVIGADVWIGEGAKIIAGVRVGEGAVIGAGAIVTKDVAPYAIAVGVPSKVIKQRFDATVCQRLSASRWWEFEEKQLAELTPLFSDPTLFLKAIEDGK